MIKISIMSGKLEGFRAINTNTLSNDFCNRMKLVEDSICFKCYSHNMLSTFRKNCVPSFEHNSRLLSGRIIPINQLPVIKDDQFRFDAHGELINANHLLNLINIVDKNKNCIFTLWTKRKDLISAYLRDNDRPANLILIYSNPFVDRPCKLPAGFNKTFNVVTSKGRLPYGRRVNCHSKCIDCLKCYRPADRTVYINELIK